MMSPKYFIPGGHRVLITVKLKRVSTEYVSNGDGVPLHVQSLRAELAGCQRRSEKHMSAAGSSQRFRAYVGTI